MTYLDKYTVEDLAKSQQLQDLLGLWVHVVDTTNANDKGKLGLWLHIEPTAQLCFSLKPDKILFLQQTQQSAVMGSRTYTSAN